MLKALLIKLFKAKWGSVPPALFKAAGEGQFGEGVKKAYWFANGYATFTGMVFVGAGTALEAIAGSYPELAWAPVTAAWIYRIGTVLAAAGLLRGGVNSPWPDGAQKQHAGK
jgi:hypothetical protein